MLPKIPSDREQKFWSILLHRLELAASAPPLSREEAAELLAQLPPRRGQETLIDRIHRAMDADNVIPVNFRPLITIYRLAADSGEIAPLPDPGRPLETADGRFRLWIRGANSKIQLTLEALGFASDEFAGRRLGLASADTYPEQTTDKIVHLHSENLIAQFALNEDGDGACEIPDSLETRQALFQPVIGLIEDDE